MQGQAPAGARGWRPCWPCVLPTPSTLGKQGGASGLTAWQVSEGQVFFVVTTTSPSWSFSHWWVTQRFPESDQDSPACGGPGQQVSPSPTAGAGPPLPLCPTVRLPEETPPPLGGLCQELALR